jgi:ParB family chromosome partitioning protein
MAHTLDPTVLQKVTKLLGVGGSTQQLVDAIHAGTPNRAWMIVLAMQIAAAEAPIGESFWRDSSAAPKRYLHFQCLVVGPSPYGQHNHLRLVVGVRQPGARCRRSGRIPPDGGSRN